MPCGVALYFDQETDAAVRRLWQQIDDAGLPSEMLNLNYSPHISVMTCDDVRMNELHDVLDEFVSHHPPVELRFHSLGVFNGQEGIIYLAPVLDRQLFELHAELWKMITPHAENPSELYSPDSWVPHVTLDMNVPQELIGQVMEALLNANRPVRGFLKAVFIADLAPGTIGFDEMYKAQLGSEL